MAFQVDLTGFNASIDRLYRLGEVRKRDIADVFRKADRGVVSLAKATVKKSPHGAYSKQYPSRTHPPGTLRKGIKFAVSKRLNLVYWVTPTSWYAMIYSVGHGRWGGNPFMERAMSIKGDQTKRLIENGLNKLIQRAKDGK
jgi:hypothetical protein